MHVRLISALVAAALLGACAAPPVEQAAPGGAAAGAAERQPPAPATATASAPDAAAQATAPATAEPVTTAAAPASAAPVTRTDAPAPSAGRVVEQFGVALRGVRLTANGYLVDVRYRVFDPARAHALLDRTVRPVLVDAATGNRFYVPTPPIVGALRQTSRNKVIHTDRDYFMLFANPERKLQAGSKVVLYLGEERFADLVVEAPADHANARAQVR